MLSNFRQTTKFLATGSRAVNHTPWTRGLRIVSLNEGANTMSRFVNCVLQSEGHEVMELNSKEMDKIESRNPDLIICPFLKSPVSKEIYEKYLTWIVHPGPKGDRGPSSVDISIGQRKDTWGVTVLEAAEEMDAGDIWCTKNYAMPHEPLTKSHMYQKFAVPTAVESIKQSLKNLDTQGFTPVPLNYEDSDIVGTLQEKYSRKIDWKQSAREVARCIRASDSSPGCPATFHKHKVKVFDCHVEETLKFPDVKPKTIVGHRNGAILVTTGNAEAVWIGVLKGKLGYKLKATETLKDECHFSNSIPALEPSVTEWKNECDLMEALLEGQYDLYERHEMSMEYLEEAILEEATSATTINNECDLMEALLEGHYDLYESHEMSIEYVEEAVLEEPTSATTTGEIIPYIPRNFELELPHGQTPPGYCESWFSVNNGTAYVYWRFYNGAWDTDQCAELRTLLNVVRHRDDINSVVLMGNPHTFSNGIHLNVCHHAEDVALESWRNINAINDVVLEIVNLRLSDKVVVSCVEGNAAAGGFMVALAADHVWASDSTIIGPHYRSMGLTGSEYWTYFFPERIGVKNAAEISYECRDVIPSEGLAMGLYDDVLSSNNFQDGVERKVEMMKEKSLLQPRRTFHNMEEKNEYLSLLQRHREEELKGMKCDFKSSFYQSCVRGFISKNSVVEYESNTALRLENVLEKVYARDTAAQEVVVHFKHQIQENKLA